MYCLGFEVERSSFRANFRSLAIIAGASLVVPFTATVALLSLHELPMVATPSTLGILVIAGAVSATAFPVLARILRSTGLMNSRIGMIALSAAAIDDLASWSLLAILAVFIRNSAISRSFVSSVSCFVLSQPMLARLFFRETIANVGKRRLAV